MGRYIDDILQPGEKVLYSTNAHWIFFCRRSRAWIVAIAFFVLSRDGRRGYADADLPGRWRRSRRFSRCTRPLTAWFHRWTTETDVTNLRVVHKTGFIKRQTFEMSLDKVESVDVNQSILGRILNYGDVTVLRRRRGRQDHQALLPRRSISATTSPRDRSGAHIHGHATKFSANFSGASGGTVDPAEIAKFSKLSDEWWDPNGKMAPLHKINPLRLTYIRDAACRKFERNVKSLNCLSGLRILDIGCGAGLLCEPFTRLGAQVIGVDPSATNIAAAKLHADKAHLSIDYRCTTVEEMDVRERFDIVLAMEVVEHVTDVGMFLNRCAAMLKPGGMMVVSTLNRNWKSFALAIVGAEYVLRWLPRGTHQWDKFVTPDELAHHLLDNKLEITEQAGVVYSPFADRWSLSSDMDVNYMVVAEGV